ncbi:hypothetical protein LO763_22380 [Glycomyces sp. A-F 0318]|uniref:hypothetical protein n=1 Tax=Glycomyces amatae TaxID=2881355 RepID=UPI001E5C3EED|nr:hypothetical protein [Glycomyces amatae]MCD0446366.1 hypothetical protein [Glycomyces amatae]
MDTSGPALTLRTGRANRVLHGRATALVLHTGALPWVADLAPGSTFTVTGPGTHAPQATVAVTRVCTHEGLSSIPDCVAGHDPEAISPGRTGWTRNLRDMFALAAATGAPVDWDDRWTVVDFALVNGGDE